MEKENESEKSKADGKDLAIYFRYLRQDINPKIVKKQALDRVPYRSFYRHYKRIFDGIARVFEKHRMDPFAYIEFFVNDKGMTERQAHELKNMMYINMFIDKIRSDARKRKIYGWIMKSVENISSECVQLGFSNTNQYMRHLIQTRRLGAYFMAGKISIYYMAAIPHFDVVVGRLDPMTKSDLGLLIDRYDMYNTEAVDAYLSVTRTKPNPIGMTDQRISEKIVDKSTPVSP